MGGKSPGWNSTAPDLKSAQLGPPGHGNFEPFTAAIFSSIRELCCLKELVRGLNEIASVRCLERTEPTVTIFTSDNNSRCENTYVKVGIGKMTCEQGKRKDTYIHWAATNSAGPGEPPR